MKKSHLPVLGFASLLLALNAFAEAPLATSEDMLKIRDPFRRPDRLIEKEIPRTELERLPVDQFKMVGVVTGPDRLKAMVTGPNGKTYFVSERTKIGVRKGVIRKITPEAIYIQEKIVNVLGQEENVETEIRLPSTHANQDGT